jgi:O-antigen biosynthesis protein
VIVSVIIVTANRPERLTRCVDALAATVLEPHELIVVDSSAEVADSAEHRLPASVRHLRVPALGVSRARNFGAALAEGDLLAFTDDDCVPSETWLVELVAALAEHSADAATGAVLPLPDPRAGMVAVSTRADPRRRVFRPSDRHPPWEIGTGGNLLVARTVFERIGGYDARFGPGGRYRAAEDIELLHRLMRGGATIVYEPAAIVYHEMKTRAERLARRFPYGYGLGAMVAKSGAAPAFALGGAYGRMQARSLARGLVRLSPREVAESLVSLSGFTVGACRGVLDG